MNWRQVERGEANQEAVRRFFAEHLCATQSECAKALGLSPMAVNRHVKAIRAQWRNNREETACSKQLSA